MNQREFVSRSNKLFKFWNNETKFSEITKY